MIDARWMVDDVVVVVEIGDGDDVVVDDGGVVISANGGVVWLGLISAN